MGLAVVALVAYARTGDVVSAEVHYRRALEIASDYPEVHNNLAHLLVHPGRFEKAERHFREAIRLLPDFGTAHNGLGCFSSDKGGLPRLVRISSEPSNTIPLTGAWFNLGQSRAKGQEWEAAAVALRRVLQLQPGFKPVHELSTVRDLRVKVFG